MFNIKKQSWNCGGITLGNDYLPETGTIDISSSSSLHPISINGIIPSGPSVPGAITTVDIKGGLTSIGKINSISGLTVTSGGSLESGMTGTIPHSTLSSGDIAQFRIDSLAGGITSFDTTTLPITPSAGSVEFIEGVEYDGIELDGSGCKCLFTVAGGIIQSVTIVTGGGGYTASTDCSFLSSIDPLTQRTFSLQISSVAAAPVIAITDPGYGYNNGESLGFIIPNGLSPDIVGTITTKTLVADFSGEGYDIGTFFLIENLNNATINVTKVDLTGAIRAFTVGLGGSGYTVGDVTLNTLPPTATLPTPATFSITAVESGGGGGSYTDAQAITALTNSTSPYVVDQTMNGDLTLTAGDLYVDDGGITVSVGDLQLQTGNLLNIPSSTIVSDAQFNATWTSNVDGSYTLKRNSIATPTTEPIELKQPFVGSGDPVPVGGVNRGAIADTENISSATITGTYKYYAADKFQVMIISYGTKFKVVFSGELLMGDTYTANDSAKAIQWDTELAYYFGDPTTTQQINAGSAGARPYGPRTSVFLPMTRRTASGTYEVILVEVHNQVAGGGTGNNYFMRFNTDLAIGDRLLFDGVEYWTESTA